MGAFGAVAALAIVAVGLGVCPGRHRSQASAAKASPTVATNAARRSHVAENYAALPLAFERNQGQSDAQVKYMARGNGYTLFLTPGDAVFSLYSRAAGKDAAMGRPSLVTAKNSSSRRAEKTARAVVRMKLVGGNAGAQVAASGELPGKSNYYIGNDPSKWQTGVAHYCARGLCGCVSRSESGVSRRTAPGGIRLCSGSGCGCWSDRICVQRQPGHEDATRRAIW